MKKQKVVIIGAGVLGLFTALELLDNDRYEVDVLDGANPGDGSSGRSVGMVETQYFTGKDVQVRAFARDVFSDLEEKHGVGFTHCGYLRLGKSEDDMTRFQESQEIQAGFGITDTELLTSAEIANRWPHLITEDVVGGLYGKWDGYVDGYEVCQTLAKLIRQRGGRVRAGTPALAADFIEGVWQIKTSEATFDADYVVNAAGAHAGQVGDMLNAPVPLQPQLQGAITIKLDGATSGTPFVMDYVPGSGVDGVYFRSEGKAHLIAGLHTDEITGDIVDPDMQLQSVTDEMLERIAGLLFGRLQNAEDLQLDRSWQGIYPTTPDLKPIVGKHPDKPGVICALGAGGSGIQLAPAIARIAAAEIKGENNAVFEIEEDWSAKRLHS